MEALMMTTQEASEEKFPMSHSLLWPTNTALNYIRTCPSVKCILLPLHSKFLLAPRHCTLLIYHHYKNQVTTLH